MRRSPMLQCRDTFSTTPWGSTLNTPIPFELPSGFDAVFIQAQGSSERIYGIVDLRGPGDQLVREIPGEGPLRTSFNPEVATALLPNTDDPRLVLEPGAYTFQIVADAEAEPLDVILYFTAREGCASTCCFRLVPGPIAPNKSSVRLFQSGC